MTLVQSLWWLTVLQRWPTLFHAIRQFLAKRLQGSSSIIYTNIINFPIISSLIVVCNSRPNSGNPNSRSYKLKSTYLRHIIPKRMDKLNESIRFWSNTYDAPSTMIKTIGRICWHLQSFSTITLFKNPLSRLYSLPIMIIIQD